MPAIAFLFINVGWVVPLLLGNQWTESVPLFRALALAAFISPVDFGSSR
jgi:O-antigen/teichoic acid export membrane protein